ncbi:MAG: DUF4179 domain-containing protein [Candidatus Gastranaerophilales bacterium]|nr:DUF4179 domain-containing protein [Candidatus Gastranaerophilales bacterium]
MNKRNFDLIDKKIFPAEPMIIHQTVLETLNTLDKNTVGGEADAKRQKKHRVIKRWAAAAAMFAVLTGTTVAAAGKFSWNQRLVEFFGHLSQEEQDTLGENGMFSEQDISATNGGITIRALQTVQDSKSLTILVQMTSEDSDLGKLLEAEDGDFDYIWLLQEDGTPMYSHPAVESVTTQYCDKEVVKTEQGLVAYQIIEFSWNLREDVTFDNLVLCLGDYRYDIGADSIVRGYWNLPIATDTQIAAELTKIYEPDQEIVIDGASCLITEVALTPLSIEINGQIPKMAYLENIFNGSYLSDGEYHYLTSEYMLEDLDGNIMATSDHIEGGGASYSVTDPFKPLYMVVRFDQVIDVDRVGAFLWKRGADTYRIELP